MLRIIVTVLLCAAFFGFTNVMAAPGDEHWSRQFAKPQSSTKMQPGTGMSMGNGKPRFLRVKWHDDKLWMSGAWLPGVSPDDISKRSPNVYWHLWTWSPELGYEPVVYFDKRGGAGPDGQIYDFVWLPDGRLVVGGAFRRVDNPGGTMYHRVNGLAVYDPSEPTADKWRPLGEFQYNGTVYKGHVEALAYDSQSNDLFIGGNFAGIFGANSRHVHRYDFDTASYEPMTPGVLSPKTFVRRIKIDTSTTPSTVYVAGKFHYTAGNGLEPPITESTSRYSTGIAKWQEGIGWTTIPEAGANEKEDILKRAADFMNFDSVNVFDFLVDGEDLWIVGSFSEGKGSGETLRGVAKWDAAAGKWIDPTGKGGIGREAWSIGKGDNGKIYIAGAFGGVRLGKEHYDGFKNGDQADMVAVFDPATGEWAQLGSGLLGLPTPEARMTVHGDDVYIVGDFKYIGRDNDKKKEWESFFIARWNETIDFDATPAVVATKAPALAGVPAPTAPLSTGNEQLVARLRQPASAQAARRAGPYRYDRHGYRHRYARDPWHGLAGRHALLRRQLGGGAQCALVRLELPRRTRLGEAGLGRARPGRGPAGDAQRPQGARRQGLGLRRPAQLQGSGDLGPGGQDLEPLQGHLERQGSDRPRGRAGRRLVIRHCLG